MWTPFINHANNVIYLSLKHAPKQTNCYMRPLTSCVLCDYYGTFWIFSKVHVAALPLIFYLNILVLSQCMPVSASQTDDPSPEYFPCV